MDGKFKILSQELGSERVKYNEHLSGHTFSQIGGPAECFFIATTERELIRVLDLSLELKIPYFILGSGSKVLISDQGIKGIVIKNRTSHIKVTGVKGKVGRSGIGVEEALVEVDSGVSISKLNEFLESQRLEDIGGFSSSFATIGGSLKFDIFLQKKLQKIKIWDEGDVKYIDPHDLKQDHIIISVVFKFKAKNA